MYTQILYVTGGDPRELQEVFRTARGVTEALLGNLLPEGEEEPRPGVRLTYDPKKTDISTLADLLFAVVDPRLPDGQGSLRGLEYCAGLWYDSEEDRPHVELYMNFLRNRGKPLAASAAPLTLNDPNTDPKRAAPCHAKSGRVKAFTPAAEAEQHYYKTHDKGEAYIDFAHLQACLQPPSGE